MMIKLTAEEQFIIHCLRSEFSSEKRPLDLDLSSINWEQTYGIASIWGLAPLLNRVLSRGLSPDIPQDFLNKTKLAYLRTFITNETNYKRLSEILKIFNESGIEPVLLKGIHLARFVYQDIGLRTMGDIDILVKKEDLQEAERLLLERGFKHLTVTNTVQWYKKNHFHIPFSHPDSIRHLEVHWSIVPPHSPFDIDIDELWQRARTVDVGVARARILSPEHTLLHICFHAAHDDMFRCGLRPFIDISEIISNHAEGIDWEKVRSTTHEWGFQRYLYLTLYLAREITGIALPDDLPVECNNDIALEAQRRIFLRETEKPAITNITHLERLHPDVSLSEKIRNIFYEIFIPPDEMRSRYRLSPSSRRVYLYYLIRPFSLLYKKYPLYAFFFNQILRKQETLDSWLTSGKSARKGG